MSLVYRPRLQGFEQYQQSPTTTPLVAKRGTDSASVEFYLPIGEALGGISPDQFASFLNSVKDVRDFTLYLSSPGGDLWDGLAMHSALSRFAKTHNVTTVVDGIAASMASVLAMASPKIVMTPSARMMIHEARAGVFGTAKDLAARIKEIEQGNDVMLGIYSKRTGIPAADVASMIAGGDRYMSAQECVDLGFADEIQGDAAQAVAASAAPARPVDTRRQLTAARLAVMLHRERAKR
jgi:ATP-dependent Clp endopeptidase proteolytic subunit ClpP